MCWHAHTHMWLYEFAATLHHTDTHNSMFALNLWFSTINTEAYMCRVCPNITVCVHISIGSRNRTNHNACHISLHVSSGTEPTHQSRHIEHTYIRSFISITYDLHISRTAQLYYDHTFTHRQHYTHVAINPLSLCALMRIRIIIHTCT